MLAICPFCGHTLLLVSGYRRGARRACDRCAEFSVFDGSTLVRFEAPDADAIKPLVKVEASPGDASRRPGRAARAG